MLPPWAVVSSTLAAGLPMIRLGDPLDNAQFNLSLIANDCQANCAKQFSEGMPLKNNLT
jgi:hypothetical protein